MTYRIRLSSYGGVSSVPQGPSYSRDFPESEMRPKKPESELEAL